MGRVRAVVCGVCLFGVTLGASDEPASHVRGVGSYAQWIIDSGVTYSTTISALTARLQKSDVIVYVSISAIDAGTAKTILLTGDRTMRYLLTRIDNRLAPDVQIEMLGHELQHAVEIAEARDVRDNAGLIALYQRIGLHRNAKTNFETALAQEMGRRARRDLSNRPPALYARSSQ